MAEFFEFPAGFRARGRNGNFVPATGRISQVDEQQALVAIYSRSEGPTAPIWVMGNKIQLAKLLRDIADKLDRP